ncbi:MULTISPECIES: type III polyketide synthase [unclassified Rhizobium]|uniref:type III polyketide synthase n=1 Tax=unclassified Rhizobium TaxID=2613769 RepID=UPI001C83B1C3|nr:MULTISPECIES: type III polyketide synthase [unclassified Rhizobium]MBX5214116.1 type III polyketide synthase [Rhizobium sp. NLR9a]MBX5233122.1 type III polyketide synthase [Rhizobium sp. NLR4a]MBX5245804.1 type III polyketide synthase [Rhizobium sp. NLR3b]MBX5250680.1 type III polyketide synthase [Rhizobium sp. NLR4b]MBX5269185.1 type III polyketide synthase [Rhizobium sp. NLR17b]
MTDTVKLASLATATPEHIIFQKQAAESSARLFAGRFEDFRHLARVFDTAGINKRHAARPLAWFDEPHGWQDRLQAYAEVAGELFVEAASLALRRAGLEAGDVDCVVTVSSTGFTTPSLDAQLSRRMGFRADIERVPVFGLGCAAGVSGFAIASRLARNRPGVVVLFVSIELCTLAFRLDELTRPNIIATALFGDGAAACVLCTSGGGLAEVESTGEHLFPDTLDIMGWKIDDGGFGIVLAQSLPPFAERELAPAVTAILARNGLRPADIDRFICHPGGMKVLAAMESALSLTPGTLDHERAVLAEYGNMSSPTVLFVLERVIRAGLPERAAMIAMGPGFSASCVTLRRAA